MSKSNFRKIYDALPTPPPAPKTAFVRRIAELCKVHEVTVRCWLAGTQKPDALKTTLIAKELGVPAETLFS